MGGFMTYATGEQPLIGDIVKFKENGRKHFVVTGVLKRQVQVTPDKDDIWGTHILDLQHLYLVSRTAT
jgi:hypothetical protein